MSQRIWAKTLMVSIILLGMVTIAPAADADHGPGTGQSFSFLQPGFTQELFAISFHFMGGVAFAPDGDPWVNDCSRFGGGELHRYDRQSTLPPFRGSSFHSETIVPSGSGCGLTNHPDGTLYTNTTDGVVNLDADSGAVLRGPFGPTGLGLGIAHDPQTGNLVYVGLDGTIHFVDPGFATTGVFSTASTGHTIDGISFDPTGEFLFLANLGPAFQVMVISRDGSLVQQLPLPSGPDGISFHASSPKFVVTSNLDGTMTRFDFPDDDYTQPPTETVFASGGFRGDLTQVGPDGCIYVTQNGTRFDDGTTALANSLVRICGGFAPTPSNMCQTAQFVVDTDDWNNAKLVRRGQLTKKAPLSLPDGTYDVTLVSFDADHGPGLQPEQTQERWLVEVFRVRSGKKDNRVYRSPAIDDLPEASQILTQQVDSAVVLDSGGDYNVRAKHDGRRGRHSVTPLCVVFTPTPTP